MGIKIGKEHIGKLYTGSTQINSVAAGNTEFIVEPDYLCFEAEEDAQFGVSFNGTGTAPILKYRINNGTWNDFAFSPEYVTLSANDKIYFKGNNDYFSGPTISAARTIFWCVKPESYDNVNVKASGNIMSLLDETCQSKIIPCDYCFYNAFVNLSVLTAPELPATTLTSHCYYKIFEGCTLLTRAPELPATTLAEYCYENMFSGCTSLTTAPELPGNTLTERCYGGMFSGCTSLTAAPELPATTLNIGCYYSMFYSCTSLTTPPELPATTLAISCYRRMFKGCTSLTTAPELPATSLTNYCYNTMFSECTSLTTPPELPATTLLGGCYSYMFEGCTSLTSAPELPATSLANNCYASMFSGCTSLTVAPELPATTLADRCYADMFSGCTSLIISDTQTTEAIHEWKIPTEGTFTNEEPYNQSGMFWGCLGTRSSSTMSGAFGESHTYYTQNQPI